MLLITQLEELVESNTRRLHISQDDLEQYSFLNESQAMLFQAGVQYNLNFKHLQEKQHKERTKNTRSRKHIGQPCFGLLFKECSLLRGVLPQSDRLSVVPFQYDNAAKLMFPSQLSTLI